MAPRRSRGAAWCAVALALAAACALLAAPAAGETVKCSASQKLALQTNALKDVIKKVEPFNETQLALSPYWTKAGEGRCQDGSEVGYYYDLPNKMQATDPALQGAPWIIWLGDSPICSGAECATQCQGSGRENTGAGNCAKYNASELAAGAGGSLDESKARCLYSRATCTSTWWPEIPAVTPRTILCHEEPWFGRYKRVFIPACTMDAWLGQGDSGAGAAPNAHRGHLMLNQVLHDLAFRFNLTYGKEFVFGGTNGAAVGLMNSLDFIMQRIDELHAVVEAQRPPTVIAKPIAPAERSFVSVLDSAWIYNNERFTPTDPGKTFVLEDYLRANTADFIDKAWLLPACLARYPKPAQAGQPDLRWRCLMPSELIKFMGGKKLFFVQSQYDLLQLNLLGLLEQNATERYVDTASFASSAIGYIENYGQSVRADIENAAARGAAATTTVSAGNSSSGVSNNATNSIFFYATPCAQNGYLVPTSVHNIDATVVEVGTFGSVSFQRNFEVWGEVQLRGLTLHDAIQQFVQSKGGPGSLSAPTDASNGVRLINNVRSDTCGTFLCNSACTTRIIPFAVLPKFSECSQYLILMYGASILLLFYVGFVLSYLEIVKWRRVVAQYWARIKLIDSDLSKNKADAVREVQTQLMTEANAKGQEYRKVHLMIESLSYWAPPKGRGKPHQILNQCNLTFAAGHVHAIMGPSGSGKSTLLDILALARDSGSISGSHYINGVASQTQECAFLREWLKHNSSYVRQSDVLFPHLTVREHLVHAAWLMLPQFLSAESKLRRVWQVLRLLELDGCADTLCGDGGVSVEGGISGGQRRRVSVATQLLKMPVVMLLDEPTSGLDSTNALLLCKALHTFAHDGGVNVLMTIHQPRKEIFDFLDTITFLVAGRVVFSGLTADAASHFKLPASTINVANEVIDKLQLSSKEDVGTFEMTYASGPLGRAVLDEMQQEISTLSRKEVDALKEVLIENSLAEGRWSWSESSSASLVAWVLISRSLKRGGFDLKTTVPMALVGGVIVGLVFLQSESYSGRTALCYLAVATMTFLQGTFLGDRYLGEKRMYDHEVDAGTFRNWIAFLISQFLRDCVSSSLEGIAFAAPVYWVGGLNPAVNRFGVFMLIMVLTSFVVICQNVLVEVDRDDLRTAAMLQIGLLGLGALFNGFIVQINDLPVYFSWVPYIMVTYWSFVATLINDLGNFTLPCPAPTSVLECAARTGDVIIRSLAYDNRDVYICILALTGFVVLFRAGAVLDFYLRYVRNRGNTMKHVADSTGSSTMMMRGESAQSFASGSKAKNTMNRMLDAKTPTVQRQQGSGAASPSPGGGYDGGDSGMASPSSFKLGSGNNNGNNNDPNALPELGFYDDGGDKVISFVQSGWQSALLDRNLVLLWFFVDFYAAVYICAFEGSPMAPIGLLVVGGFFSAVWAIFFVFQLVTLTPTTLDGKLDCTWAGGHDALAALTLVIDIALTFQLSATSSEFAVQLVLTMIVRFMRGIRVLVFWSKVDLYHYVRAKSFLDLKDQLVEEEAMVVEKNGSKRISGFDLAGAPSGPAPARPLRPQRPPRPGQGGSGQRNPAFTAAVANRPVSMAMKRTSANMRQTSGGAAAMFVPISRQAPQRPATRPNAASSVGFAPAAPPSRPQAPQRPQFAAAPQYGGQPSINPADLGPMWRPAGQGAYYNSFTGQVLTLKQISQVRRAPPPPPQ